MAVTFQIQEIKFKLEKAATIKLWIKKIIELEKKKQGQINFVFTNDEEILKTNIQYLNHNTYTDIITFDYCEGKIINGDIIISIDRVKENSDKLGVDFTEELHRVIIHGTLHLCGYKDKSKEDATLMRKKENWALKKV
ncbi:rRNA maturation RNase YbeY [Aurantibacillus circumpalustris]|uniref:rRNA maturation RNase YbeY n=1 Tax=Aurantibacillus circumpalustris TaxID=3036359 RepID=UPI00295AE332|nr:rRNA maturation RNase YbeY [Aurantibacillus circumpalustris]